MGTKVHCKSYLPGYYSMRDLNEDSSSSSWPLFYGDRTVTNGQYYNGFMPRTIVDGYPGYDKDALKQKMLEHEAVFKNQVYELHRLYRIQRDMMEEIKRKELHNHRASMEPSSSSSLQGSQKPSEDARKWHMGRLPLLNSGYGRTSVSGVEIAFSPLSCTKGNITQSGQFPFQNGCTSKNPEPEALDSRPLKVRKKLFDLRLPADEYIDTDEGEKLQNYKVFDTSSYAPNGNPKCTSDSSMKLFLGGHVSVKTDCQGNSSASGSCLRGSVKLADLNEPIQVEEAMAPASVDLFGHTSILGNAKSNNQVSKPNAGYLGVTGEAIHVRDGFFVKSSIESKANERGRLSHTYEAGSSKTNLSSVTQGPQQDKLPIPSHPVQGMLNQVHHSPGKYPTVHCREDLWREAPHHGLEFSDTCRDHHNNSHFEPLVASETPGSYPFSNSSCFANSWAHSVSSWKKPTSIYTQKMTTFGSSFNSTAVMDINLQPSDQIQDIFGEKWRVNASARLNPGSGSELSTLNGLYHGSASGSKEVQVHLPSAGFDCLNWSRGNNVASDRSATHGFGNLPKGSCHLDLKPARDINLNEVLSKSSSNEAVTLQDLNMIDRKSKPEGHLSALPWLKPKPSCGTEASNIRTSEFSKDLSYLHASSEKSSCKSETVRDLNQLFTPKVMLASNDCEITGKKEIAETQNVKKILGVPIFETGAPIKEPVVSTLASFDSPSEGKNVTDERKNRMIDINLACEPDEQTAAEVLTVEKEMHTKGGVSIRNYIDLNSCVSDCDDPPSYARKNPGVKIIVEIDLEAPIFLESEDDNTPSKEKMPDQVSLLLLENKSEQIQDDVARNAAETIVSISSSCQEIHVEDSICHPSEVSLAESLLWFVDAMSLCANELKRKSGKDSRVRDGAPLPDFFEEIDDFEAMTLQIAETKEEDYIPKPFIPEFQKVEETKTLPNRSRRGHARRGRQRRDFQRDILPGLTSLSRLEVTEDLQIFGGLMRATGHSWNSGLTRRNGTRNGRARGRRRAVVETVPTPILTTVCTPLIQQLNNIESSLEDRSLTGWGKTTRRPRRQRCPAGNPPTTVALV